MQVTSPHGREPALLLAGSPKGVAKDAYGAVSSRGVVASCSRSKDVRLYNMQVSAFCSPSCLMVVPFHHPLFHVAAIFLTS